MRRRLCTCGFIHDEGADIVIAKDGWPLEQFINRPFVNFLRRLLHGSFIEGSECYYNRTGVRVK